MNKSLQRKEFEAKGERFQSFSSFMKIMLKLEGNKGAKKSLGIVKIVFGIINSKRWTSCSKTKKSFVNRAYHHELATKDEHFEILREKIKIKEMKISIKFSEEGLEDFRTKRTG